MIHCRHSVWILAIFLISSLGLSRLYKADITLYSVGDDDFYWSYARRVVYDHNLNFSQEPLRTFRQFPKIINFASPFPGFLWMPAVLCGRLLGPVIEYFPNVVFDSAQRGYSTYHRLLISAFSACLTLGGLLFIYRTVSFWLPSREALIGTLATFISSPLPYYTFRRPLMSHSAEIFSLGAFVWLSRMALSSTALWAPFLAGISMAIAIGVRYPNVFVIGSWILVLAFSGAQPIPFRPRWWLSMIIGFLIPIILQFLVWKDVQGVWLPSAGVYSMQSSSLLHHLIIGKATFAHLWQIAVGSGWGLLWLETPLVFAIWASIEARGRAGQSLRLLFLGCIPLLLIAANFPSQGGSYGYRYLLAKEVWMAFALTTFLTLHPARRFKILIGLSLLFPIAALILFESGPEELTLHLSAVDWVNDQFALNVFRSIQHQPQQLMFALTGSPVGHLMIWMLSKTVGLTFLPEAIRSKAMSRLESISLREAAWYYGWMWLFALGFWRTYEGRFVERNIE
jgi:hypothetical protein